MNFCFYLVQLNSILNNRSEENLIKTKIIFTDMYFNIMRLTFKNSRSRSPGVLRKNVKDEKGKQEFSAENNQIQNRKKLSLL